MKNGRRDSVNPPGSRLARAQPFTTAHETTCVWPTTRAEAARGNQGSRGEVTEAWPVHGWPLPGGRKGAACAMPPSGRCLAGKRRTRAVVIDACVRLQSRSRCGAQPRQVVDGARSRFQVQEARATRRPAGSILRRDRVFPETADELRSRRSADRVGRPTAPNWRTISGVGAPSPWPSPFGQRVP
jgi:hypothetical protein